jgi:hypothetical protein
VKSDGTLQDIVIEGLNEETIKQRKPEAEAATENSSGTEER